MIQSSITLCIIARNEAALIAHTIASVKDITTECLVVDLGSNDGTVHIATGLGARVIPCVWEGSYSTPRNLAIDHATSDWILVLDPGEALADRDCSIVQHLTVDRRFCFEFPVRSYSNDSTHGFFHPCRGEYAEMECDAAGYIEFSAVRLFPRHPKLRFEGEMHELIELSIRELGELKIVRSRVPIHNYTFVRARCQDDLQDSKEACADSVHAGLSWQDLYRRSLEFKACGKFEQSLETLYAAVAINPRHEKSWVEIGNLLCRLGRYVEAGSALETALKISPDCHEAHCEMGAVALWRKDYVAAERSLRKAIKINNKYIEAYCHLATVLAVMRRLSEAEATLQAALEFVPQSARIRSDLGTIYYSIGERQKAEQYLLEAVSTDPSALKAYYQLGQIYKDSSREAEAVKAFTKYLELGEKKQRLSFSKDYQHTLDRIRGECELLKHRLLALR